jgi:hypothetical protein
MQGTRSIHLFSKMLNVIGLAVLVFSTFLTGSVGIAHAQGASAGGYYYYVDGQRVSLNPSQKWVSVTFASEDAAAQSAALAKADAMLGTLDQARHFPHLKLTLLPVVNGSASTVDSLRAEKTFSQVSPVFQTSDAEMAVTDQFIVTFPAGMSMDEINAVNSSYGAEIVEPILGQDNTFVLRATDKAQLDILSLANSYQESGVAVYAAPNFVRIVQRPLSESQPRQDVGPMAGTNDTLYADQWYLNNTQQYGSWMTADADIDAPEAWNITPGSSSIIIAVIDEGTDLTHEDYASKLVPGYDATGLGSGGHPSGNDAHGTNVAGLAAASSNNSLGIAGVCQNCKIMPIRIAYSVSGNWVTTDATLANGITWAYQNGAHVLNNSWGGGTAATVINTAISNAKTLGRGGLGAVVLFAAGNDNASTVAYPGYLSTVIAVGASNMCDQRKAPINDGCNGGELWGSNYGIDLDVSAPGVWLDSTDIMGTAGYVSGNYYGYFNGTSGATPIVSGIVGLMLSVNPGLTAIDVQNILQSTAQDVNGGGFDVYMGHGRVNAYAAVSAAASSSTTFVDVPASYWAYNFIERLYNAGITSGCSTSPMMYCPDAYVTRAQMAIFILRGIHGSSYVPPAVGASTGFTDVPTSHWAAAWIKQFAAEGITGGCGSGTFCPEANVTRDSMAVFLLRGKYTSVYNPPPATGTVFTDVPTSHWAAAWIERLYAEGITGGCGSGMYCPAAYVSRAQMAVFIVKTFNLP